MIDRAGIGTTMQPRWGLGSLVIAATLARLAWAAALPPGPDEAYYALFPEHPDWSYHDHPPMLAAVEWAGLRAFGRRLPRALALRSGFLALAAGSSLIVARLTARRFGARAGWFAAFLLTVSGYFGCAAGSFALPDGPLVFFWLLTLDRLAAALDEPDRVGPWIGVGLAWGGAMLSKYHAVFLPAGLLLYLATDRAARACLRRPGPYLACAIGSLLFAPVALWNARHGWGSFAFQAGRAVGGDGFRAGRLAAFVAGQAAYLLPWVWASLLLAAWRRRRHSDPCERFLLAQAALPIAAFLVLSGFRPVLPHWSLVGFLSLIPLAARDAAGWSRARPGRARRRFGLMAAAPLVGMLLFAGQARWGWLGAWPAGSDPSAEMHGWDQVAGELRRRGLADRPGTFLFTGRWYDSGRLAFALGPATPVLCYNAADARGFAHWSRPADWVGADGVLVVARDSSTEPQVFDRWFRSIEPLGSIAVRRGGRAVRSVRLYLCRGQLRPFPFDGASPPAAGPARLASADGAGRVR